MSRLSLSAVVLCLAFAISPNPARSATWTWDGQSAADSGWSAATNWAGDTPPVSDPGTDLAFPTGGNFSSVSNDLGTFLLRNLTISGSTALGFFGDPLQIYGSIVSESSGACGFLTPILLGADATLRAQQGGLYIVSNVVNNGHTLSVEGPAQTVFMGAISGSGGLIVSNSGNVILTASNNYTGGTVINGGLFQANPYSLSGTTSLTVQGNSTAGLFGETGLFGPQTQNRHALVTGSNANLNVTASPVQFGGISNTITAANGGHVTGGNLSLGVDSGSAHEAIVVDGAGSSLFLSDHLIAASGTAHRITVQHGGTVGATYIEVYNSANSLLVTDAGSSLTGTYIAVLGSAQRNAINILDGGAAEASGGIHLNGLDNTVRVSGAGSTLRGNMYVGMAGPSSGTHIEVSNGGRLETFNIVTAMSATSNTYISVTDPGSFVGAPTGAMPGSVQLGNRDIVDVRNGGTFELAPSWFGNGSEVRVTGAGSTLGGTNTFSPSLMTGNGNLLAISNGATAYLPGIQVATPSNRILVAGANSHLLITGGLLQSGGGSLLSITDGAELRAANITVDANDTLLVSGAGTEVTAGGITSAYSSGFNGSIMVNSGAQVSVNGLSVMSDLRVTSGGHVDSGQTTSLGLPSIEISGAGSVWSNQHDVLLSNPNLAVMDGAKAHIGGMLIVNGLTTVLVHGADTELATAGDINMNAPELRVTDGAHLHAQNALLLTQTTLVSGAGTRFNMAGDLSLPIGRLTIENGAEVHNVNATVGQYGLVTATVHSATWSNSGHLQVINQSAVNISGSSHVSAASLSVQTNSTTRMDSGTLTVGHLTTTGGTVAVNGGTLNVSSSEYVSAEAWQIGNGTDAATLNLAAAGGRHRITGGLIVNPNAQLTGQGTIQGDVTVKGDLSPGNSAGLLDVEGTLTLEQYADTLIELYGASASEYDQIEADTINYGGTLNIAFNFTPTNGQRFQVFTAGGYSGSFTSTNITGIYAGGFDATSGEVFVTAAIPEPSVLALLALGLAAVYRHQNRRR